MPKDLELFFDAWLGAAVIGFDKKVWISLMYVVIWNIWWIRNSMAFDNFKPDWPNEIQNVKIWLLEKRVE